MVRLLQIVISETASAPEKPRMKIERFGCALLISLASGCSLFSPQETEVFGDIAVNVRFTEAEGADSSLPGDRFAKENWPAGAPALDRFVITVFSYTPQLEQAGGELVRRELIVGEDRRLSASVRVPLRSAEGDYFLAEVLAFQRLDLIYSGSSVFQFDPDTKSATIEVFLQPVAFFSSFIPQPNLPRFVLGQATALDSTISAFDFEGSGISATVPLGRANQANNAILLWGDTTVAKVRARRLGVFRGEMTGRFSYTGVRADVLIACTWNPPVDFDLEIVNPQGQTISATSPGDVPNGSGALIITSAAYGPEVFEWRAGRITSGQFRVNVTRPNAGALGEGTVYVIRREGTAQQTIEAFPFEFQPSDTQNTRQVFSFTWPQ